MGRYKRQGLVMSSKSFARIVNTQIRNCNNWDEVAKIVLKTDRGQMDAINISTALVQLAKHSTSKQPEAATVYKKLVTLLAAQNVQQMGQQVVSNVIWAMAKSGMASYNSTCRRAFIDMLQSAHKIADKFPQQGLNNIVWAMGKSGIVDRSLFETSLSLIIKLSTKEAIQPQSLSNIVWAIARCKQSIDISENKFEALEQICELCTLQLGQFSSVQMGTLMWSVRNLGYYDRKFTQNVLQFYQGKEECFGSLYEMSSTLLAFADFNIQSKHVVTCAAQLLQNNDNPEQQAVFNGIYGMTILGSSAEFVLPTIQVLGASNSDNQLQEIWLTQMYKSIMLLEYRENVAVTVSQSFKDKCQNSFVRYLKQQSHLQSQFLEDVVGCLNALQLGWSFCQQDIEKYGADVEILIDRNRVSYLKVLSPTCYTYNEPKILLGSVVATIELFQLRQKIELVCIPYFEWSSCKIREDKLNYLRSKLLMQE